MDLGREGQKCARRASTERCEGRELGLLEKEEEGKGERAMESRSYTSRKRRRTRARALPEAAGAKPGGQHHAHDYRLYLYNYLIDFFIFN